MPPFPDLPFPTRYQETVALESVLPRGTALRYEQLPLMPPLSDDLTWITPLPRNDEMATAGEAASKIVSFVHYSAVVDQREREALQLALRLPPSLLTLLRSPRIIQRLPDPVSSYFLAGRIQPCPQTTNGFVLRFMGDPQTSCAFYLYLTPSGDEAVLFAEEKLDKLFDDKLAQTYGDPEQILEGFLKTVIVCFPSFKEFLYRHWIENRIYFKLVWGKDEEGHPISEQEGETTLTEEETEYLAFVRRAIQSS